MAWTVVPMARTSPTKAFYGRTKEVRDVEENCLIFKRVVYTCARFSASRESVALFCCPFKSIELDFSMAKRFAELCSRDRWICPSMVRVVPSRVGTSMPPKQSRMAPWLEVGGRRSTFSYGCLKRNSDLQWSGKSARDARSDVRWVGAKGLQVGLQYILYCAGQEWACVERL